MLKRIKQLIIAAAILMVSVPAHAVHAVPVINQYQLQQDPNYGYGSASGDIVTGPDGNLWMTGGNHWYTFNRVTPAGQVTVFEVPRLTPWHMTFVNGIAAGPDNNLWITGYDQHQDNFELPTVGYVARVTTDGQITKFTIPTQDPYPFGITAGPDGAMWFTETYGRKIGRIAMDGTITEYQLDQTATPRNITTGPDGNLWFTDLYGNRISKMTTAGIVTDYLVPTAASHPSDITVGSDGALWFTQANAAQMGRVTTTGVFSEFPASHGYGITTGPDGNVWYADTNGGVGYVTPAGDHVEYDTPGGFGAVFITTGPDGNLWFTQGDGKQLNQLIMQEEPQAPDAPVVSAQSPVQTPVLQWSAVDGADRYNVYRDGAGTPVATVQQTTYTDSSVLADGSHTYTVTAVSAQDAESEASNTVTVLVDTTAPTITYAISPLPNAAGWNNTDVTVTFTCGDALSGVATCPQPVVVNADTANQVINGTAVDAAGNTATASATVKVDKTAPAVTNLTVSPALVFFIGTLTITADANDALSGVAQAEYFIDTDPGVGNATPMAYDAATGKVTASKFVGLGSLGFGNHTVSVRAKDTAGNWSAVTSRTFFYLGF